MSGQVISIVTASNASAAERFAAEELQKYAGLCGVSEPLIFKVGTAEHLSVPDVPDGDGFLLRREGDTIIVAGGSPRGTLYAVYALIERFWGVRFLSPYAEYIPGKQALPFPETVEIRETPAFAFRENQWYEMCYSGTQEQNADFAVKSCNLGSMCEGLDEKHGGNILYPGTHTFNTLCPCEEYFDSHPEYYALVDGKRFGHPTRSQLCLTNPDVLKIVIQNLKKRIRENPEYTIFAVAQNDGYGYCECPACSAIDEEEGSHAGTVIRFVNAVAEAIEPEFPNVIIDTLAYNYSRTAPLKTKPRHNVVVRICTIESCLSHPLRDCQEKNGAYFVRDDKKDKLGMLNDDLAAWGKICTHYNCWTYVTNFSHYTAPVPNLWVLADNMKFLKENGITDLRLQGNRQSISGEMGSLRGYVSGKLLWNPDRSTDKLLLEFCTGYYGMAAAPILAYLRMVNRKGAEIHAGLYDQPWKVSYLDQDYLDQAEKYFVQAKAMADNETILRRVEKAYLSVEYVRLLTVEAERMTREEAEKALQAFVEKAKSFGISYLREVGGAKRTAEEILRGNIETLLNDRYGKK